MLEEKASPEEEQGKAINAYKKHILDREKAPLFVFDQSRSDKRSLLRAVIDGDCLLFCPVLGTSGPDPEYATPGGRRMRLSELRTWVESKRSILMGPDE